jgi:hypothetical protein
MPTRFTLDFVDLFALHATYCGSIPAIESEPAAEFAARL